MFSWFKKLFTLESKAKGVDKVFSDWSIISYENLLQHFEVKKTAKEKGEKKFTCNSSKNT